MEVSELAAAAQLRAVRSLSRSDLASFLASHPVLALAAQRELLRHVGGAAGELLAGRSGLDPGVQLELARRRGSVALVLARNVDLDPTAARALLGVDPALDLALAQNPASPLDVLSRLWDSWLPGSRVSDALAAADALPFECLQVSSLPDRSQSLVARSRVLTLAQLEQLRLGNVPRLVLHRRFPGPLGEFFLHLAPTWPGTLAEALFLVDGFSLESLELLAGLAPDWSGSLEDLLHAARALDSSPPAPPLSSPSCVD